MTALRSALFAAALIVITPPYALLALCTGALPRLARYRIISGWSRCVVWLARWICGIRWQVEGLEHLPDRPAVILSKHQSAWETLAFQMIFPPQVYLLKRELLWIPFFGWGLALMSPIAIDRSRGRAALRQLAARGAERLAQGFWIVVFPEGTRMAPGRHRKYQLGGAWLAARTHAPVVPVAHNAGLCWPRNGFLKRPGLVTVRVGPTIDSAGRTAETVNQLAETWIEDQQRELCPSN
ncbi:MAG: 1-acyl-sn-glycerol-3-phosphate acyltransferase [Betaproteobacteria bacterium]|jgi:1-acyl-sn-glycerol-3-phosphate acyltransferase|nr:1-acyl-sn-glycerol-3-phosphate acyltransferase [Betaproteobacteria bacterium]